MARNMSGSLREDFTFMQALTSGWKRILDLLRVVPERQLLAFSQQPVHLPLAEQQSLAPRPMYVLSQNRPGFAGRVVAQSNSRSHHCPEASLAWADLMARMSHDLRTPLNAVIGFSDVMSAEMLGPVGHPRYREYAGDIRVCGQKLLKAAEDTLAMTALLTSAAPQPAAHPISLATLASEAWSFCSDVAEARQVRLFLDCTAELEILGELRPMRQALVNLFSEALSRTPDFGHIKMSAVSDRDTVRIEIGVDDAILPDDAATGASLPLSLARALLELQGAGLLEIAGGEPSWCVVTIVDAVNQQDFFPSAQIASWQPAVAYC